MTNGDVAAPGPQTRVDPRVGATLSSVGRAVRWLTALYSGVVLAGVVFQPVEESLPQGPTFIRDITHTSALFLTVMATGALFAGDVRRSVSGSVAWRRVGVVLATVSGLFGSIVVSLYLVDSVDDWPQRLGGLPAFSVGIILVALAVAVILMTNRKELPVVIGQVSALLVFSLTGMIFLGYALGDPSLGRLFQRPEISFHSALIGLWIAVGTILIRPGSGLLSAAVSPGAGGRLLRRFGPVVLLAPAGLIALTETMQAGDRIDAVAFVAVTMGLLLLILLGSLVRVIDVTQREVLTAGAQAERARAGLDQEAPVASSLSDVLHLVDVEDLAGWEVVTRFRPGHGVVAGDSSAVRILPDGSIGLVLVDVTGHGAGPAVKSVRLRDLLLHSLSVGQDPAAALESVLWMGEHEVLASAIAIKVDSTSGNAQLASAGHPPVIHLATQTASLFGPTGPLLFLHPDATYSNSSLELATGDALVLFSDGVADVQRQYHGLPEPEALADMLLAEGGVTTRTAELVLGFADPEPSDDQSVVVIVRL